MKNVNPGIKKSLLRQEKALSSYDLDKEYLKKISDDIIEKTNKDKSELLIRNSEGHRIKQEINKLLYDKKSKKEQFSEENGPNMW